MVNIHIGCGEVNFGKDWIHVDGVLHYRHINHQNIYLFNHESNTADIIYSSHFLEYFSPENAYGLFLNWKRVLKLEGILRIAVPDFEAMAKLYVDARFTLKSFLGPLYGMMYLNNKVIYHKTVYDFYSLAALLKKAGFKSIERYDWRETEHTDIDDCSMSYLPHDFEAIETHNFTDKHTLISLNVEATK